MHDCSNSSALAMELLQSCNKPSIHAPSGKICQYSWNNIAVISIVQGCIYSFLQLCQDRFISIPAYYLCVYLSDTGCINCRISPTARVQRGRQSGFHAIQFSVVFTRATVLTLYLIFYDVPWELKSTLHKTHKVNLHVQFNQYAVLDFCTSCALL